MENKKGCVYFFRHIGLTPVKIGYSENQSPINRFNQFKTYAPYGSEILGFIMIQDAKELETALHAKYASKRLDGEWFELTEEEVNREIDFYTSVSDVEERNRFQIAWAKQNAEEKEKVKLEVFENSQSNFEKVKQIHRKNPNLNRSKTAELLGISRQQVIRLLKQIEEN